MGGVRILSKHPKDQKSEWIGLIRKHYAPPHDTLYKGEKVFSRSEDNYVTEFGKRDKTEGFRQRQRNLTCGYFSLPSRPYRPVGEPVLESLHLLIDTLDDCLPQKFYGELYAKQERLATPNKLSDKERRYTQMILYDKDKDLLRNSSYLHRQERQKQNVGMKGIKSILSETERRIIACRSGQSYVTHVTLCQEAKDRAREEANERMSRRNEMCLQRLSSSTLHAPLTEGASIFTGTTHKKKLTFDDTDEDQDTDEETEDLPTMVPLKGPRRGQNLRDFRQSLKLNSLVKKLECISIIMHSLHNMRTKHLKSRNPMGLETVMILRKDPFAARDFGGINTSIKIVSRMGYTPSRYAMMSRQETQLYESPASRMSVTNRLPNIYSNQLTMQTQDKLVRPSFGGAFKNLRRNTRIIMKLMQDGSDSPVTLETWDDLLNVGSKNRILHLIRKIPPWQLPISTAETFLARKRNKEKKDEDEDDYDVESVVQNFQLEMQAVKEKLQKHTEQELEKVERERLIKFKYKLSSFENMPTLYETHSSTLAEITRRINRAPELSEEEKTTRWYQALVEEVKSIRASGDPDVCHKMTKLERFALEETTAIPNVNEKLCLLTLSLPIHEICTFEMQSAITFVLKEILDVRVELMEEWMRYRHLRSM